MVPDDKDPRPDFDPDLSRSSEHNQEAARSRGLRYSERNKQYVDEDGCPVRDEFGQPL